MNRTGASRLIHCSAPSTIVASRSLLIRTFPGTKIPGSTADQRNRARPVFHHREDRIGAHIQLCWLVLLLIRVTETTTGDTWRNRRHELDSPHLVTLAPPAARSPRAAR